MRARTLFAGLATAAVTVSALALGTTPAQAAVDPDDTTFTPVTADLVGVGSDTSQHALKLLAGQWNNQTPAPAFKLASFAATGGGTVTLATGTDIARPNGSGAGKGLLYGAGNNPAVDYARSSSALNDAEVNAGLQAFPFAVDQLQMAVSGSVASNAPASLSDADIVKIYKGDVTNWSQLGGKDGVIKPKIPQAGSGTRSFFESQLKAANGGVAVTLAASVQNVQEHDDADIKGDANAVAPFSSGRAGLLGTTLRLEDGWKAKRALYNVVRLADVNKPEILKIFGAQGLACSTEGLPLIEAAGFEQLASQANGGVCGIQTQAATSNFAVNTSIATTTKVTVTSTAPKKVTVTATIVADTAPQGTVEFFDGATKVGGPVALTSGQAVLTLASAPGKRTFKAVFTPEDGSNFLTSEGSGSGTVKDVVVKATSSIKATFPKVVKKGAVAKGSVVVTLKGSKTKATGQVVVKRGAKVLGKGTLKAGKAKVTLKGLKKGKNKLTVTWAGNAVAKPAKATVSITRKK